MINTRYGQLNNAGGYVHEQIKLYDHTFSSPVHIKTIIIMY